MLNGETKDFDWASVAEDFVGAVMGLTAAAAKASPLLAPLAEFFAFASSDTDGKHMQALDYMIQELQGFNDEHDRQSIKALRNGDEEALEYLDEVTVSFWFTERDVSNFDTEFTLHSSWGGLESAPREARTFIIGGRETERQTWKNTTGFIGYAEKRGKR